MNNKKRCPHCGVEKLATREFFSPDKNHKFGICSWCKECNNNCANDKYATNQKFREAEIDRIRKASLPQELKVNGCAICGYDKCMCALEFHHSNPKDKNFNLSGKILAKHSNAEIVAELNKCVLLCANCHKEISLLDRQRLASNP